MEFEENPNNPTITSGQKINIEHCFIVRYMDDTIKKQMIDLILKLVNKHEIGNFYIEEQIAYQTNRIIYNSHTLISKNDDFNFKEVDVIFLKYLH